MSLLSDLFQICRQAYSLELVDGARLFVPFAMVVSRYRILTVWSLCFAIPTTWHSFFFFFTAAPASDKGFPRNDGREWDPTGCFTKHMLVAGMPVIGEADNQRCVGRYSTMPRTSETFSRAERWEMTSVTIHSANWFTADYNDRHFLAFYIQTIEVEDECFTVNHNFDSFCPV